jgi:hypothetical protein
MQEKYYLEVDECPLFNWRKASDGKRHFLRRDKIGTQDEDLKAWDLLFADYVEKIGLSKEFIEYLENLEKLNKINKKIIDSGNRFLLNDRAYILIEIKAFEDSVQANKSDITDVLLMLSKVQSYHLEEKKITVLEYFRLIKNMK